MTSTADALFPAVRQRVLAVLFGSPDRSFYANELIALARSGTGAVQRELASLLAAGLVRYYQQTGPSDGLIAVITRDGQLVERIDLQQVNAPRQIILPGPYHEIVQVEPGRIRFQQADCPDKICVHTGWLEEPGDVAVCLPNRAVVKIED